MQYLLDTHAFLWFINGDTQLSDKARTLIENPDNDRYISIASFWEMAIKLSLGKLELDMSFKDLVREVDKNGFNLLPITAAHTEKIISLDLHHRDPFDRMLICQALADKLTIITADSQFQNYKLSKCGNSNNLTIITKPFQTLQLPQNYSIHLPINARAGNLDLFM